MKKLLKLFGYIHKSELQATALNPEISLKDYERTNEIFHDYWKAACQHNYTAKHIKHIAAHPKILQEFLYQFSMFNWKKVHDHMVRTDWTWGGGKGYIPDIIDLQSNVIELLAACINHLDNNTQECSSGGFIVTLNNNEVKINFNYEL